MSIQEMAQKAKEASLALAAVDTETKNKALEAVAKALRERSGAIAAANLDDLKVAEQEKLAAPLLKRLKFDEGKLEGVCIGIEHLIRLEDPVGRTLSSTELDTGLELYKVSSPIGVIGVIFESRPDALVQIGTLCLKSGNAVLLKGGSEAKNTNRILADTIHDAGVSAGLPVGWLGLLETRADVAAMLALDDSIDLIIPRGSNEFVQYIMNNTNIPVLGHADGICHVYVDGKTDIDMAVQISLDAKCQYVAVCNATETLLVDEAIAEEFLPIIEHEFEERGVEIRGCEQTREIISCHREATEDDWRTEYLDMTISMKVVNGMDEAIEHINKYGSHHTDAIVTGDKERAMKFISLVDSADVFWNCSTRFSDGFVFGLGAEVGISTNKIHARGPVGLEGLVIYKYILIGNGHVRGPYSAGEKDYTHKRIEKQFDPKS